MGEGRRVLAARNASEAVKAGLKAAAVTSVVTAIPTVLAVRLIPWARANLNPTAQALIVSIAAGSAYFVVADQQILHHARANSSHQRMHGQKVEHP